MVSTSYAAIDRFPHGKVMSAVNVIVCRGQASEPSKLSMSTFKTPRQRVHTRGMP